jgi:cytochrome c-type biogenesis protein
VGSLTWAHIAPAFAIGLLATINPCVLPLYPGFLAYLAKDPAGHGSAGVRYLGPAVLAGVLTMILALGALIAGLTAALAEWTAVALQPLGVGMMVLMGLLLLLDVNPFARLPILAAPAAGKGPYPRAFLYGLLFGPMVMPCAGPLVVSIFSLSIGVLGFVEQLLFFAIFGLGFGLPLLVLAFLPQTWNERLLRWFGRRSRAINILSGLILIAFGIWNFRTSWELIGLYAGR